MQASVTRLCAPESRLRASSQRESLCPAKLHKCSVARVIEESARHAEKQACPRDSSLSEGDLCCKGVGEPGGGGGG